MLRIENLLLRGDGQVTQGRMLEETSLVQGPVENGGGGGAGSGSSGGGGGGSGGGGPSAPSTTPNGAHHDTGLGALGAMTECLVSRALQMQSFEIDRPSLTLYWLLCRRVLWSCSIGYL